MCLVCYILCSNNTFVLGPKHNRLLPVQNQFWSLACKHHRNINISNKCMGIVNRIHTRCGEWCRGSYVVVVILGTLDVTLVFGAAVPTLVGRRLFILGTHLM